MIQNLKTYSPKSKLSERETGAVGKEYRNFRCDKYKYGTQVKYYKIVPR